MMQEERERRGSELWKAASFPERERLLRDAGVVYDSANWLCQQYWFALPGAIRENILKQLPRSLADAS